MDLNLDLSLKQTQKIIMTPELHQALRILQFSAMELHQFAESEMEINPFLEQKEEPVEEIRIGDTHPMDQELPVDWKEYFKDSRSYYRNEMEGMAYSTDEEEMSYENVVPQKISLREHLLLQLDVMKLSEVDQKIATFMIESLDDNGYLRMSKHEIADILNINRAKVSELLKVIQDMDPSGVGARSLRECLIIQLKQRGELNDTVRSMVLEHLKDMASKRYAVIARKLGISIEEAQRIGDLIKSLEPKPGRGFSASQVRYILPDVYIREMGRGYEVVVNETALPHLQVSEYYSKLLASPQDQEVSEYLNKRLQSALWLIKCIEQRKMTLAKVVAAITEVQQEFFDKGVMYLKPLNLKRIAEMAQIHESTVSRAISGKYAQTPKGTFELKYFFSSGINAADGEGVSSESIKKRIKEIIEGEDVRKPLSDNKITRMLQDEGVELSRRTVAKYREEMNIASSQGRKRY